MFNSKAGIGCMGRTTYKTLTLALAIATCLPTYSMAAEQQASPESIVNFNIPAGDLSAALERFSTQSGIQAMYRQDLVAGKRASAVKGSLSPSVALNMLLAGTELTSERVNAKTYVLKAAPGKERSKAPGKPKVTPRSPTDGSNRGGEVKSLDDVVVVGSRLGTSPVESAMPIKLISREEIDRSGAGNIAQALSYLSEISLSNSGDREIGLGTGLIEGGNTNSSTVQMRGLPKGTTLVLINGRRAGDSAAFSSTGQFDLSTIPLSLVERIEVLPSGSSAVYGGDGLAGVINVILRRDASGLELRARRSIADGYHRESVSATWGKSWDKGSMTLAVNWNENGALLTTERKLTADQDLRPYGGRDYRTWVGDPPTVYSLAGCPSLPTPCGGVPIENRGPLPGLSSSIATAPLGRNGTGLTPSDFIATQGQESKNSRSRHLISPESNYGVTFTGQVEVLPKLEVFSELTYTHRDVPAYEVPFVIPGNTGSAVGRLAADHPFNPFGVPIGVTYTQATTGVYTEFNHEHKRALLGLRGKVGGFDWELSGMQSRDTANTLGPRGTVDQMALAEALAIIDPALAINPFITDGSSILPPDRLRALFNTGLKHLQARRNDLWTGYVRGPLFELPAGQVHGLLGGEHQRQAVDISTNDTSTPVKSVEGVSKSKAAFAEIRIPVLAARKGSDYERVALTGATRLESSDRYAEDTQSNTLGIEYRPTSSILVRSTYSTAFRPLIAYSSVQDPMPTTWTVRDPVFGGQSFRVPGLRSGGVPPEMKPETSTTKTFGVVYRPSADLSLSVTHWDTEFRDRIAATSAQDLVDNEAYFRSRVIRDPVTRMITLLDVRQINVSLFDSKGVDIAADASFDTRAGYFNLGLAASYVYKHETQLTDESPVNENVSVRRSEGWAPRWKIVPRVSWEPRDGINTMLVGRYVSRYVDSVALANGPRAGTYPKMGDFWIFDINADLAVGRFWGQGTRYEGARLTLGVTNLFNNEPIFCMGCYERAYDSSVYDIVGRTYYAEMRWNF